MRTQIAVTRPVTTIGLDEVGRGSLAGPVVAGACWLNPRRRNVRIADSKALTLTEREKAFAWIAQHCKYGIGMVSATEIDDIGILAATEKAMQLAIVDLKRHIEPEYLLVDGRDKFTFAYPHTSIIRGDQKERCISAASIVAKVIRDRLMTDLAVSFPEYGFDRHKGYGTDIHCSAIRKHGLCVLHRRSFVGRIISGENDSDNLSVTQNPQ